MENKNIYLSTNLKYLREINNKTQQDVAKYCDKTNTAISNWEKGIREPDAIDLSKLSQFFSISIDDLMLKDLRIDHNKNNELEVLFSKYKDILSDKDKEYMKFIINQAKNEIDKQLGEDK